MILVTQGVADGRYEMTAFCKHELSTAHQSNITLYRFKKC